MIAGLTVAGWLVGMLAVLALLVFLFGKAVKAFDRFFPN